MARELLGLYEATEGGEGFPGIYILGSLRDPNEQIAVSRQQERAINLVHALCGPAGPLRPGRTVCVIGAGVAGLTAAAYAIKRGLGVTVLENRKPLWNLRGCRTRWLHPNLFALWPRPGWNVTATHLPVMNWYADYADRVGELLWSKYTSHDRSNPLSPKNLGPCIEIDRVQLLDPSNGSPRVRWHRREADGDTVESFDAVILAMGFGSEARMRDAVASVYWLDDALERPDPHRADTRYLISGTGDGGLTDLLRIRLRDFRHHHLRELLLSVPDGIQRQVAELDRELAAQYLRAGQVPDARRALARAEVDGLFSWRLRAIANSYALSLTTMVRHDTHAWLTGREASAFSPGRAWPVSRFLAALLLEKDPGRTRYFSSGPQGVHVEAGESSQGMAPTQFTVATPSGRLEVDAVVYRHGTTCVVRGFLRGCGMSDALIERIAAKWSLAWVEQGTTGERRYDYEASHDGHTRAPSCMVRPTSPGRTPIGLLSRLVAHVDDRVAQVEATESGLLANLEDMRTDLVIDELALAVSAWDEQRDGRSARWYLLGEVQMAKVVDVIRRIDQVLECMLGDGKCAPVSEADARCRYCRDTTVAERIAQCEQHWVLPRRSWMPSPASNALLLNTVAARRWGARRLSYHRCEVLPDTWAQTLQDTFADPEHECFVVVDHEHEALPLRVAITRSRDAEVERLARELQVDKIVYC
jgi:FAD dependent oxidoreductase